MKYFIFTFNLNIKHVKGDKCVKKEKKVKKYF